MTRSSLGVCWDRRGIRLTDGAIALDSGAEAGATFVGHALVGPRRGQRLITSDLTARLMGARLGPSLVTPFHRPFFLGVLELELLPTGLYPGAAALRVTQGGHTLLYAGEVGSGATLLGLPGPEPRCCDHLVIRATHGHWGLRLPPSGETVERLVTFLCEVRDQGRITLLHSSPLGVIQALVSPLRSAGLAVRAHRQVHRFFAPLRAAGVSLPPVARFQGEVVSGEVLLWPAEARPALAAPPFGPLCRVLVSGRAALEEEVAAAGCEVGFAISNHADHDALVSYIRACGPRRVTLVEHPAPPVVAALRGEGIALEVLGPPEQLEMFTAPLGLAAPGGHSRVS